MAEPTARQRMDEIEEKLSSLPTDPVARHTALIAVIAQLTEDWPRDAYPRLTKISRRAARLWVELGQESDEG